MHALLFRVFPFVLALTTLAAPALAAGPKEWRSRSIYQVSFKRSFDLLNNSNLVYLPIGVMTDRFARTDNSTTAPCASSSTSYCGGSWKGIENKLDYVQGMGFTAVSTVLSRSSFLNLLSPSPRSGSVLSLNRYPVIILMRERRIMVKCSTLFFFGANLE